MIYFTLKIVVDNTKPTAANIRLKILVDWYAGNVPWLICEVLSISGDKDNKNYVIYDKMWLELYNITSILF